jgi:hypothetical protein
MTEPRILTDDESYRRRREAASSMGPKTVAVCAHPGCPTIANWGPYCDDHRRPRVVGDSVARPLTREEIDAVRAQVEADAAPLFLIAVNWLAREQMARIGIGAPELAFGIERIRGELDGPPA